MVPSNPGSPMAALNQDLIPKILLGLPVKSLVRFRCLSKPDQIEIDDTAFINAHLARSVQTNTRRKLLFHSVNGDTHLVDFEEGRIGRAIKLNDQFKPIGRLGIFGSCNGLILLYDWMSDFLAEISSWNPFPRRYRKLPDCPDYSTFYCRDPLVGLGCDSETNDHKVVIIDDRVLCSKAKVLVFSLASNSWRKVQVNCEEKLSQIIYEQRCGTCAHGALHWLCPEYERDPWIMSIVSFDLSKEEFLRVIPPFQPCHTSSIFSLKVLRPGHMFLFEEYFSDDYAGTNFVLFEMIKNGDMSFDRRTLHQFGLKNKDYGSLDVHLSELSKDGNKILMQLRQGVLGWYDIKRTSFERLEIGSDVHNSCYHGASSFSFSWESLVSLGAADNS